MQNQTMGALATLKGEISDSMRAMADGESTDYSFAACGVLRSLVIRMPRETGSADTNHLRRIRGQCAEAGPFQRPRRKLECPSSSLTG